MPATIHNEPTSFYIMPIDQSRKWKYLIEAQNPVEFQQRLARRYFNDVSFMTVYGNAKDWETVKELDGWPKSPVILDKSMITRSESIRIWGLALRTMQAI